MPIKLGVTIIHGMGNQDPSFADGLVKELKQRLKDAGAKASEACWERVFWADIVEPRETALWDRLSAEHDLDYVRIRKFVLSAFGDAIAYQRVPGQRVNVYEQIHARIRSHLRSLRRQMGDADLPVIFIAHSLGCAMMSNYIWDRQKEIRQGILDGTATERLEQLTGIVTFGCNLPLFSLAYDQLESISFPPPTLPPALKPVAKWMNFFDPDDVLGYPLKPISPSYRQAVTADIPINVGGIFSSWNPLSHSEYWTDDDFTKPVSRLILDILQKL